MTVALSHSWYMTARHLRAMWRQPWWIAVSLVQPVVWLLLFGQLFRAVVDLPGFRSGSYADFLTPGIVVMTAVFSGGWNGMTMLEDMGRGITDRFLTSPASRVALIVGPIGQMAVGTVVQTLVIVALGLGVGATFSGGALGVAVLIVCGCLLGAAMGALSNALALVARRQETMVAGVQFVALPLTFLSAGMMQLSLAPHWIQVVARFNPVDWAVEAGRQALVSPAVDWSFVGTRVGYLAAFVVVCAAVATRAFRSYQRSI